MDQNNPVGGGGFGSGSGSGSSGSTTGSDVGSGSGSGATGGGMLGSGTFTGSTGGGTSTSGTSAGGSLGSGSMGGSSMGGSSMGSGGNEGAHGGSESALCPTCGQSTNRGLETFLGKIGITSEMIDSLKGQWQSVDLDEYMNTAREYLKDGSSKATSYAKENPGKVAAGVAALAVGVGLIYAAANRDKA